MPASIILLPTKSTQNYHHDDGLNVKITAYERKKCWFQFISCVLLCVCILIVRYKNRGSRAQISRQKLIILCIVSTQKPKKSMSDHTLIALTLRMWFTNNNKHFILKVIIASQNQKMRNCPSTYKATSLTIITSLLI